MTTSVDTRTTYPHIMCSIPDIEYHNIIECYNYRWEEKYVYLLHSILYPSILKKNSFQNYTNLHSSILKRVLGEKYYRKVLNQLLNSDIIQALRDDNGREVYSRNAHSKAYRINPKYTTGTRIKWIPIHKQTYCRKIAQLKEKNLLDAFKINPLSQHEFLQMTRRRIDVERAFMYIEQNYENASPQFNARIVAVRNFNLMKDASFAQGKTKISFDFIQNKGRIYTPATSLPRDLEQFTYFDGDYENEHSVNIDMPNSQLCFFNELVKRESKKVQHLGTTDSEVYQEINKHPCTPEKSLKVAKHNPSILLTSINPYVLNFNTSWEDYIFNGLGYERMMFLCKWMGKEQGHTKDERQEFKAEFFGQLFYNKYSDAFTDMEQVFMTYHENEAKALREMKRVAGNRKRQRKRKKDGEWITYEGGSKLAVQVQDLEGNFFHNVIVGYMKANYIDVPFTIKHDSITMPKSCASYILPELNKLVREFFHRNDIELKADIL